MTNITCQITEFPLPSRNSSPAGIAAGSDGALWFTAGNGGWIGSITLAGQVTRFPLPVRANGHPT